MPMDFNKFSPLHEFMPPLDNMREGLSYCSDDCLLKHIPPSAKVVRLGEGKPHTEYAIYYEQKMLLQCCSGKRSSLHPLGQYELSFSYRNAYCNLANSPHDNVVRIFNSCDCVYEIEFIKGNVLYDAGTIPHWLKYEFATRMMMEDRYSWKSWSSWMKDLIQGLRHLHKQGIAHGDVMPFNVMITNDDKNALWIDLENISYDPVQIRRDSISFLFNVFGFSILNVKSYPHDFFVQLSQVLKGIKSCDELLAVLEKLLIVDTNEMKSSDEEEIFSLFVSSISGEAGHFTPTKSFYEIDDVFLMNFWGMRQYFKSAHLFSKQGENIALQRQKVYWRDKEIQRLIKNHNSSEDIIRTLENKILTVCLYFDTGLGFNEIDKLETTIAPDDCGCKVVFDIKKPNIHIVRFDPGEVPAILRLNGVILNDGNSEFKMSSNGVNHNSDILFTSQDPNITIESSDNIQKIIFDCDFIKPIPLDASGFFIELIDDFYALKKKDAKQSDHLAKERAKGIALAKKLKVEETKNNTLKAELKQIKGSNEALALQIKQYLQQLDKSLQEKRNLESYLSRQFHSVLWKRAILSLLTKTVYFLLRGKVFQAKRLFQAYITIHKSGMFDPAYYIEQNNDIALAGVNPLLHYLLYGCFEGRNPSLLFDTGFYLAQHPDVAKHGMNPLLHYIRYGQDADYKASPLINPSTKLTKEKPLSVCSSVSCYPPGISIIIPTYNGGGLFKQTLNAIAEQEFAGSQELIIVDSGSSDGTDKLAEHYGAIVKRISKEKFHHSRTRQWALQFAQYDRVVYMVQDAIPINKKWLNVLYNSLDEGVAAAYGCQIPHKDADLYARFETESHTKYLGDVRRIQSMSFCKKVKYRDELYRYRLDNVCSIYLHQAIEEIPFPDTPYAEDMAWARNATQKGKDILYCPEIQIRHSHNRPADYRFRRTIVDIVTCAKILEQIRIDLRPAGISEVKALKEFSKLLYEKKMQELNSSNSSSSDIFKKSLCKKVISKGKGYISKPIDRIFLEIENGVNHSLNLIEQWYPEATDAELGECISQTIAVFHGSAIGEIYASYLLNGEGNIPSELEEYIQPLMKGI